MPRTVAVASVRYGAGPSAMSCKITGSLRQFWPDAPPPKQNFFDDVPELLARGQHIEGPIAQML
jgi:hypothetical protein